MTPKCSVVIASKGRPELLLQTVREVLQQSLTPAELIVCVVDESDFPQPDQFPELVKRILSKPGLTKQRNAGIDALTSNPSFVTFLDDDMILHPEYLREIANVFMAYPRCVGLMGHLLENGGVTSSEARELTASPPELGTNQGQSYVMQEVYGRRLYGCNMSFRFSLLDRERFDERLPLYSEMEDVDFGTRAGHHGDIMYSFKPLAVHLRTATGRINHRMHGFSQVMNPVYLAKKGSLPIVKTLCWHLALRPIANLLKAANPSETKKRLDLVSGNLFAIANILIGRIEPERLLMIKK